MNKELIKNDIIKRKSNYNSINPTSQRNLKATKTDINYKSLVRNTSSIGMYMEDQSSVINLSKMYPKKKISSYKSVRPIKFLEKKQNQYLEMPSTV